jgi:hypothetical protein
VKTSRTDRFRAGAVRLLLVSSLALGALVGMAASAQAHRDGCHRWHSCPSDTGSYVCGDLGYYSECPGGRPSVTDDGEEYDSTAPRAPKMSSPVARAKGVVTFAVKAERGSKIVVTDDSGDVVKRLTGTGSPQTVRLTGRSGAREYTATATDRSGNESSRSKAISVTADSTPPSAGNVQVRPASADDVSSTLSFVTEPGTRYDLAVSGRKKHIRGTTTTSLQDLRVWVPNGTYELVLSLTDEVGNKRTVKQALRVAVSKPNLLVERSSPATTKPVVLTVTAPARSTGVVRLAGLADTPFEVADTGRAEVTLALDDGDHAPASVELTDALGRTATMDSPRLLVDTVKPALRVDLDAEPADHGLLRLSVLAERATRVTVKAVRPDQAPLIAAFAGTGRPQAFQRQLGTGDYTVDVIATDAAGNTTTWKQPVRVVVPLSAAGWLAILLVLLAAGAGVWFAWRRREHIAAWRARRKAEAQERAAQRRRAEAEAAYARALQDFAIVKAGYERDEAAWQARRVDLQELLDIATNGVRTSLTSPPGHKPRKGERVLTLIQGAMVEERSRQGETVTVQVGSGTFVVSDQRITFIGDRSREWAYDKLIRKVDVGADTTLLTVTNRKTASGVFYPSDSERTRVIIDVAVESAITGRRERTVAGVRSLIAQHDGRRPEPPSEPRPPHVD